MNNNSIYIVEVMEDGKKYQYEYGNIIHAREHLKNEITGSIIEYMNGKYYLLEYK